MMRNLLLSTVLAFGLLSGSALAAEQGNADEAKALAEKAAAHLNAVGKEKALADFMDPQSGFFLKDLFVFTYDAATGTLTSAGAMPALLGKDATKFKDADGKEFAKEMIQTATANGAGWVDYKFLDPATKKVRPKSSYAIKAGDQVVAVGYYK